VFERAWGRGTTKRSFIVFIASSGFLYLLAILLGVRGGWDAALPVLAVAVIVDTLVLIAWLAFGRKNSA
jgi:hypothetical protein